ncbi:MAG: aspartate aminotransferase family protein [Pseudomonadales bacterium]|nr:aspartate aminotransferase family protein [Pseudomonadales bacterium]
MPLVKFVRALNMRHRSSPAIKKIANHKTTAKAGIFDQHSLPELEDMMTKGFSLIKKTISSKDSPFSGILPAELAPKFGDLNLDTPKASLDEALKELEELYLDDAVYFHHPKYMAHLNTPVTNHTILAEFIQACVNTSVDTWDQSAGGTFIEQKLIDWTMERIGYIPADKNADGHGGDGIFTSGGTQSNLMAMLLARDNYCLEHLNGHSIQLHGLPQQASRFRFFTSKISHFSVQKAAALLGLGYDAVIPVDVDEHFRMDPIKFRKAVEQCAANGDIPVAAVATMGTTDFGSIDPIAEMADVCNEYNMWLHADAAYGCGLLVSEKYGARINDINLADSVTVDYHKSFLQPVACSAFIAKNSAHFGCLTYHADYLNPLSQKLEGTPNLVCKSIQTTRRFDALKLWLTIRTIGPRTIGDAFDAVIDLATAAYEDHCNDSDIEFIHTPSLSTLVFRFKPKHIEDNAALEDINLHIRKSISRDAKALVASTKVHGLLYLKLTLLNPATELSDVNDVIHMVKQYGNAYVNTLSQNIENDTDLLAGTA